MAKKKVAGTLMEHKGKLLLLYRDDGMWGLPAGGVEPGEDNLAAAVREIHEETGYTAKKADMHLEHVYKNQFKTPKGKDIIFTLFRLAVPKMFNVKLDPKEHTDFRWVTPQEAYTIPGSIPGLKTVFKDAYDLK
jgi:8-oxo-dGTP pyrophosphatase MutT (NUDIX family)